MVAAVVVFLSAVSRSVPAQEQDLRIPYPCLGAGTWQGDGTGVGLTRKNPYGVLAEAKENGMQPTPDSFSVCSS